MVETTPPPPKSGGSGGFIAAAVVMLLAMGGLIYWKVAGKKQPVPEPPPPPSQTAKPHMFTQPPPPPPPVADLKEAGTDAGKPETHKVVHSSGGGCSGTCRGRETSRLLSALSAKGGQARGCYQHALRLNSTLKGEMMIQVRVGPRGQVCSAHVTSNNLGSASVTNCVVQMFRAGTFPAPHGGCVDVRIPLKFEAKQ